MSVLTFDLWRIICRYLEKSGNKNDILQTRLLCRNSEAAANEIVFTQISISNAESLFIHHRLDCIDIYIDFPRTTCTDLETLREMCKDLRKIVLWNLKTQNEQSIFDLEITTQMLKNAVIKHPKIKCLDLQKIKKLDLTKYFPNLRKIESNSCDFSMFRITPDSRNLSFWNLINTVKISDLTLSQVDENCVFPEFHDLVDFKISFKDSYKFQIHQFQQHQLQCLRFENYKGKNLTLCNVTFTKEDFLLFCETVYKDLKCLRIYSEQDVKEYFFPESLAKLCEKSLFLNQVVFFKSKSIYISFHIDEKVRNLLLSESLNHMDIFELRQAIDCL